MRTPIPEPAETSSESSQKVGAAPQMYSRISPYQSARRIRQGSQAVRSRRRRSAARDSAMISAGGAREVSSSGSRDGEGRSLSGGRARSVPEGPIAPGVLTRTAAR